MPKTEVNTQVSDTPEETVQEENQEEISFSEEQQEKVNELISLRLERAEKSWKAKLEKMQQEAQQEILKAKEEGERLAKLSAEEREKEVLEKQRRENEEREKLLSMRENKLEAISIFSKANVPIELVDYVVDPDKEKTLEKAELFIKNYQTSVEQTVAKKLEGEPPKDVDNKNAILKTGLKSAY